MTVLLMLHGLNPAHIRVRDALVFYQALGNDVGDSTDGT